MPHPALSVVGQVGLNNSSTLEPSVLYHATARNTCLAAVKAVGSRLDSEVGQRDLIWVSVTDMGGSKEPSLDFLLIKVQLEVATVVQFRPLQDLVGGCE